MTITPADLHAADVLLYGGDDILARLIRFFDRSEVNHAGLYLGHSKVGEALAEGVVRQALDKSLGGSKRVMARRMVTPAASMDPVLTRANGFLDEGHRYGYEQILLLAFLSLTRRIKVNSIVGALVRKILDEASTWILNCFGGGGVRQPMICSEFVYRTFDEALPASDDVYTISIDLATPRDAGRRGHLAKGRGIEEGSMLSMALRPGVRVARRAHTPPDPRSLETMARQYLEERPARAAMRALTPAEVAQLAPAIEAFAEAWASATTAPAQRRGPGEDLMQTLSRAAADFVTPGDLYRSPSLFEVGDLKGG